MPNDKATPVLPDHVLGRRAFLVDAATFAAMGAGAFAFGRGDAFAAMPRALSRRISPLVPNRPFNMVAFGDSMMWGQGLAAEQKFTTQVQRWLERWLSPRPVQRFVFAHSGAKIGPCGIAPDAPCVPDRSSTPSPGEIEVPGSFAGEVPGSAPTIFDQIARALVALPARGVAAQDVDLVLVDGGINDVDLNFILNPRTLEGDVRSRTQQRGGAMKSLVSRVALSFPSAKVAVIGYFPILSNQSNPLEISPWLQLLGFAVVGMPVLAGAAAAVGLPPAATAVALTAAAIASLVNKTKIFYDESAAALQDGVQRENTARPFTSPAGMPNVHLQGHIVYVDAGFAASNSYAAPDSWLFKFSESMSDGVSAGRFSACEAMFGSPPPPSSLVDANICHHAAIGHPNPAGAAAYATAIQAQLTPFLGDWMGLKKPMITVQGAPSMEPARQSTLTVLVKDPDSSQPVNGMVRIAQQNFPTNRPFAVTLCPARVVSKVTSRTDVTSNDQQVGVCASSIIVTAAGYFDALLPLTDLTNVRFQLPSAPPHSAGPVPPPPPPSLAVDVAVGSYNASTGKASLTVTARDSRTGEIKTGTVQVDNQRAELQATGTTGHAISFTPCRDFDSRLRKFIGQGTCTVRVNVPGFPVATTEAGLP